MTIRRILRWRIYRGLQRLDLVEEGRSSGRSDYVGLIDGKEAVRGFRKLEAGVALIRAAHP